MTYAHPSLILGSISINLSRAAIQADIGCETDNAYAAETDDGAYEFDLLCKPVLLETIEIETDESITVTINLERYYEATGNTEADFSLHFGMQRARIVISEEGIIGGEEIVDSEGALQDIELTTSEPTYTVIIENEGLRSAIFDLSLRLN